MTNTTTQGRELPTCTLAWALEHAEPGSQLTNFECYYMRGELACRPCWINPYHGLSMDEPISDEVMLNGGGPTLFTPAREWVTHFIHGGTVYSIVPEQSAEPAQPDLAAIAEQVRALQAAVEQLQGKTQPVELPDAEDERRLPANDTGPSRKDHKYSIGQRVYHDGRGCMVLHHDYVKGQGWFYTLVEDADKDGRTWYCGVPQAIVKPGAYLPMPAPPQAQEASDGQH